MDAPKTSKLKSCWDALGVDMKKVKPDARRNQCMCITNYVLASNQSPDQMEDDADQQLGGRMDDDVDDQVNINASQLNLTTLQDYLNERPNLQEGGIDLLMQALGISDSTQGDQQEKEEKEEEQQQEEQQGDD